jgi:flagellar hook-length control protein FliK
MFENKIGKVIEKDKPIEKQGDSISNNNGNSNINVVSELKGKQFLAKQVIKNFNQNLDEAIKNYKPPISKIDIELNPKNLGKVEVTIIQRGNNIQVNMNSDQSNIALFQTNQADFKQALSNIGFSNIDMSFNSNQDKEKKQNQAKKSYKDNEEFEEMGEIEIQANYQYA